MTRKLSITIYCDQNGVPVKHHSVLSTLTLTIFSTHWLVATITDSIIRLLRQISLKAKCYLLKSEIPTLANQTTSAS